MKKLTDHSFSKRFTKDPLSPIWHRDYESFRLIVSKQDTIYNIYLLQEDNQVFIGSSYDISFILNFSEILDDLIIE